jgi:hypothetical protein
MTANDAEDLLRRNIAARLGEARAVELAPLLRSTAEAMAQVLNEPIELDEEAPDFVRPLT